MAGFCGPVQARARAQPTGGSTFPWVRAHPAPHPARGVAETLPVPWPRERPCTAAPRFCAPAGTQTWSAQRARQARRAGTCRPHAPPLPTRRPLDVTFLPWQPPVGSRLPAAAEGRSLTEAEARNRARARAHGDQRQQAQATARRRHTSHLWGPRLSQLSTPLSCPQLQRSILVAWAQKLAVSARGRRRRRQALAGGHSAPQLNQARLQVAPPPEAPVPTAAAAAAACTGRFARRAFHPAGAAAAAGGEGARAPRAPRAD